MIEKFELFVNKASHKLKISSLFWCAYLSPTFFHGNNEIFTYYNYCSDYVTLIFIQRQI